MPSRWPSPPTRSPWRCARSARSRERRTAVLIDPKMSGLPPFLTEDSGVNSGPDDPAGHRRRAGQREQVARLPGKRRFDPDLGGQEDHVSMAPIAGAQGGADRAQRRRRDRGRVDRRRSGHRLPRAAENLSRSCRRCMPKCANVRCTSSPTGIGPTRWLRFRRLCSQERSATQNSCRLLCSSCIALASLTSRRDPSGSSCR